MPAEWDPHAATWLAWPHNAETWLDKLEAAPPVWCEMVRALVPREPVNVLVNSNEHRPLQRPLRTPGSDYQCPLPLHSHQ